MKNITVDFVEYRVRIVFNSLVRSFKVTEGPNSGVAITGRQIRDIIGTGYSYTVNIEPDPRYPEDYDSFYEVISSPVNYHTVRFPYGQSEIEFDAMIESGEDTMGSTIGGTTRWHGLSLTFTPIKLQREV